jgi:hypothetical protein
MGRLIRALELPLRSQAAAARVDQRAPVAQAVAELGARLVAEAAARAVMAQARRAPLVAQQG